MCNIAGYAGSRQAAPILLEMLKRQEYYDGNVSTGIATIHEGKLYYRKLVGDVDNLIQNSDVLDLPGTIGIAHTRPSGTPGTVAAQPCLSTDETLALVTNGTTPKTKYCANWDAAVDMLNEKGYAFRHTNPASCKSPKLKRNGCHISVLEARIALTQMYVQEGRSFPQAMALACAHMYSDNVTVMLGEHDPDSIFALRSTRPLLALAEGGETYLATCRYAFDEGKGDMAEYLPLHYACQIARNGVTVTEHKMDIEPVAEITPETFQACYNRLCKLLSVKKADALYFDELEFAVLDMRDIFEGNYTYLQHARLVYDVLWQLDKESRLCRELRQQESKYGLRKRYYMWLND